MPSPKTVKPIASHLHNWTLAKGGRSFDAGPFRVRSEAAGPVEHQLQVLKLASCAPRLLVQLKACVLELEAVMDEDDAAESEILDFSRELIAELKEAGIK